MFVFNASLQNKGKLRGFCDSLIIEVHSPTTVAFQGECRWALQLQAKQSVLSFTSKGVIIPECLCFPTSFSHVVFCFVTL